jgi:hypothetical protein
MSKDELVQAYVDGGVSRRTFIRRLVGAGVSMGAAVSYAHLLAPERASAASTPNADFYNPPTLQLDVGSKSLTAVVHKGKIKLNLVVSEPATVALVAAATLGGKAKQVSRLTVDFPAAGQQLVTLRIGRSIRKAFGDLDKTNVTVTATATDRQGATGTATDQQKLK